jgi:hypothetical protein
MAAMAEEGLLLEQAVRLGRAVCTEGCGPQLVQSDVHQTVWRTSVGAPAMTLFNRASVTLKHTGLQQATTLLGLTSTELQKRHCYQAFGERTNSMTRCDHCYLFELM